MEEENFEYTDDEEQANDSEVALGACRRVLASLSLWDVSLLHHQHRAFSLYIFRKCLLQQQGPS
jgi:hypothetical protein